MKKIFIVLSSICFLATNVQAQTQVQELVGKKSVKKPAKKTKIHNSKKVSQPQNIQSRNGTMKVHYIDQYEVLDTTGQPGGQPSHINHNFNENQPPLSPSNGSK